MLTAIWRPARIALAPTCSLTTKQKRTVRHIDGKGTLIDVTDAKTEAGERTLKLPRALQPQVVSPHGIRGTHAKMAREVGVSGVLLAAAMGHESETTTTEHYAGRTAVANAAIDRVAGLVG